MKPIFENLRRLVAGKRKKKEKDSGFKRSESFKRISIRKSYLDRGKKKNLPKLEVATQTVPEEELSKIFEYTCKVDSAIQVDRDDVSASNYMELPRRRGVHSQLKNGHTQKEKSNDVVPLDSYGAKGSERTVIYVPGSDDGLSPPTIRDLPSSPSFKRKSASHSGLLERKESNDSAVEMFPWGDSVNVPHSPTLNEKSKMRRVPSLMPSDSGNEEMCSLSISLGRIWMDAPQAMSPRTLEIPRSQTNINPPAHRSLDSALRDMKDCSVVSNRLQKRQVFSVSRTSSSNSNNTNSTGLPSSRDSGLSFSGPVACFGDKQCTKMTYGFFGKQKSKPLVSSYRDNYFKRNNRMGSRRNSVKRKSSRKKNKLKGKKQNSSSKCDIYQVIVGRRPRQLSFLKLDPMIFVPPEKRNPSVRRKKSFKREMCEIRNLNLNENTYVSLDSNTDEDLYESLPDDLDMDLWEDDQIKSSYTSRLQRIENDCDSQEERLIRSSDDEDSASDNDSSINNNYILRLSPVTKSRPVRRRKYNGISRKRNATFVVRPTIVRAPSTLKRPKKKGGEERTHKLSSKRNNCYTTTSYKEKAKKSKRKRKILKNDSSEEGRVNETDRSKNNAQDDEEKTESSKKSEATGNGAK
ncbi:hypothetical protein WA026_016463 [Henosepilachna vigintioctopunctata]|uniref:Uncharacterized protein n=1 Tax=Henosepilachna vigintioctopunctata TaxID=420089 RepID=A0AAW1UK30_9CUCU